MDMKMMKQSVNHVITTLFAYYKNTKSLKNKNQYRKKVNATFMVFKRIGIFMIIYITVIPLKKSNKP